MDIAKSAVSLSRKVCTISSHGTPYLYLWTEPVLLAQSFDVPDNNQASIDNRHVSLRKMHVLYLQLVAKISCASDVFLRTHPSCRRDDHFTLLIIAALVIRTVRSISSHITTKTSQTPNNIFSRTHSKSASKLHTLLYGVKFQRVFRMGTGKDIVWRLVGASLAVTVCTRFSHVAQYPSYLYSSFFFHVCVHCSPTYLMYRTKISTSLSQGLCFRKPSQLMVDISQSPRMFLHTNLSYRRFRRWISYLECTFNSLPHYLSTVSSMYRADMIFTMLIILSLPEYVSTIQSPFVLPTFCSSETFLYTCTSYRRDKLFALPDSLCVSLHNL